MTCKLKGIPDYVSTREASHSDGQPTEAHDDLRLCLERNKLDPARIMIEGSGLGFEDMSGVGIQ
jgi:hypothetical protein